MYKAEYWWNDLELDEQLLLIKMLYNMSESDFWEYNVMVDKTTDKYVERR